MFQDKKVVVVMPAYNAAKTLRRTYEELMEQGVVDRVVVVDDASRDETVAVARSLPGARVHIHPKNRGYGADENFTSTRRSWFRPWLPSSATNYTPAYWDPVSLGDTPCEVGCPCGNTLPIAF